MIIIIFPQMAQRSLPAVLLLLLGFVEAVDIKGNKIVTVITIFLVVFVIKLSSSLSSSPSFTLVLLVEAKAHFLSIWISFLLRPRISFSKCNEFLLQIPPIFCHFFLRTIRLSVGCIKASEDEIPDKHPPSPSLFLTKPFSLIPTLPLIPNPRILAQISIWHQQFKVQNKSNSCDGTK